MRGRLLNISLVASFCSLFLINFAQAQTGLSGKGSALSYDSVEDAKKLAKQIDELIEKRWKGTNIKPAPMSSDSEFFRRLHLDISGRVPFLLETRDFIEDESTDKRSRWIEKLIEGDRYPIHFSYVWRSIMLPIKADPQSLAGGNQFELWLKERLKKNLSYDQLAKEVINIVRNAGEMGNPAFFYTFNGNKPEDKASPTARVFLGVKLECAQCHAHPFAEWTRDQFWQTAAFFTQQTNLPNFQVDGAIGFAPPINQPVPNAAYPRPSITIPGDKKKVVKATFLDGTEPKESSSLNGPAVLANWIATKENKFFAKAAVDHVWSHFFGVSLLDPILDNDKTAITHPELLNHLAKEFANHDFDLKYLVRAIVYTKAYQRTSKSAKKDEEQLAFFARMPVRGLSPEQLYDSITMVANPLYEENLQQNGQLYLQQVQLGGQGGPRTQFLLKFIDPTKRTEAHTSILQALFMMNGEFLNDKIDPKKNSWIPVLASASGDSKRQVETVYLIALSRMPTQNELGRLIPFVESGGPTQNRAQALADVLWALLNSSEFMVNH